MKRIIIDTNAILRFLLKDIPAQHKMVEEKVKKASLGKLMIIIPEVIIFEAFFTLSTYYEYKKEKLIEILESLISASYFEVESRSDLVEALKIYKMVSMSLVDSFLIAKSRNLNVGLFSFDRKLLKYAKNC